jgi:glycosyltransferase involved in cell wall biosynthesis
MKFSVIIPTYNRANSFLGRAIESVLNQDHKDFELLIIDDCSTDRTQTLVESYSDKRITYFKRAINGGNAAARNDGVRLSNSDYITFLDSDDEFYPFYLSRFNEVVNAHTDGKFFFGGYEIYNEGYIKYSVLWRAENTVRGNFLRELKIGIGCGVVIHKECFEEVGIFDEELRVAVDTDFLIRLEKIYNFTIINEFLIRINEHNGPRVRKDTRKLADAYARIIEKHRDEIVSSKKLTLKWFYKLMWLRYHARQIRAGNESYRFMKQARVGSYKVFIIHAIFNFLPYSIALKIHKRNVS